MAEVAQKDPWDDAEEEVTSTPPEEVTEETIGLSGQRLKSYIERIENLEAEKKNLTEDISDIYTEVKAAGFEPKIVRKLISLRKMDLEKRREESELLELYMAAIGLKE